MYDSQVAKIEKETLVVLSRIVALEAALKEAQMQYQRLEGARVLLDMLMAEPRDD